MVSSISALLPHQSATQTARKQEPLCAVCSTSGEEREEMKSISCNAKNAAKLKDPSNTTVKGILFFSCSDSVPRQQEKGVHPAKLRQAGEAMRTWEAALFPWDYSSPQPELTSTSEQNSPWARFSQRASRNFPHLLMPFRAYQSKMKGRKSWAQWTEYFLIHDLGHSDEKRIALSFHGSGRELTGFSAQPAEVSAQLR